MMYMRGMTKAGAARAAGYTESHQWYKFFNSEGVATVIEYLRQKEFSDIRVTRDSITAMLMEAHSKAANTTEEVKAIVELAKLHNVYPAAPKSGGGGTQVNVNLNGGSVDGLEGIEIKNEKQLERMSDAQLAHLAKDMLADAMKEPKLIEGRIVDSD